MRVNVTMENAKMKITVKGEVDAAMWGLAGPGKTRNKRDQLLTIPIDDRINQTLIWAVRLPGEKPVVEGAVLVLAHHGPTMPLTIVGARAGALVTLATPHRIRGTASC
jgi:hypothetical protein